MRQPLWCHRCVRPRTDSAYCSQPQFTARSHSKRVRPPCEVPRMAFAVAPSQECEWATPLQLCVLHDSSVEQRRAVGRPDQLARLAPAFTMRQPAGIPCRDQCQRPSQWAWHPTGNDGKGREHTEHTKPHDHPSRRTPFKPARCGCVGRATRVRHRMRFHGQGTSARAYRLRSPATVGKSRARFRKTSSIRDRATGSATDRARACPVGNASAGDGVRYHDQVLQSLATVCWLVIHVKTEMASLMIQPVMPIRQPLRAIINCLISPIALAGFRPFGQVRVQFMMVWQR